MKVVIIMAKYTITIKTLLDNKFDLGLKDYPIFDEDYRNTLNQEIIDYYFMSEIGFETPALFKRMLNSRMQLIMNKYNLMYKAQKELLDKDLLLGNVDLTTTYGGETNSKSNGTNSYGTKTSGNSKQVYLDTPQGNTFKGSIDDTNYATDVTFNKADNNSSTNYNGENTGNIKESYLKKMIGNNGNKYAIEIYNKYLSSFRNIDLMVIHDLEDLFMGLL